MYTQEEYLYGWLFYLLGVLVIMACGWWITRNISTNWVRQILRLGAFAFFTVPWYASPEMEFLAPAWIIAGFEGVFDGGEAFWRAGAPLLSAVAVACVLVLGWQLVRKALGR